MGKCAQKGMKKMILKVMRSSKASEKVRVRVRKSSALVWREGDDSLQSSPKAQRMLRTRREAAAYGQMQQHRGWRGP